MTIFFVSPEPEICHILSKQLSQHNCFVFSSFTNLINMLSSLSTMPDLLVMDYLSFNHDLFDIYKEMNKNSAYIPLIFYNDPTLILPTRSLHWKHVIEYQKPDYVEFTVTEEYEKIFNKIEEIVESEELSPYIPLMQTWKRLPKEIKNYDDFTKMITSQDEEKLMYLRKHLSSAQYFLFNIFYNNINEYLSLEALLKEYSANDRQMTEKSLEVVISRLRKKLRELDKVGFIIESHNKNYILIEH